MVDFAGSTGDVTDGAEGMQSCDLKQYHGRIALSQCLTANTRFGASGGVTSITFRGKLTVCGSNDR